MNGKYKSIQIQPGESADCKEELQKLKLIYSKKAERKKRKTSKIPDPAADES